MNKIGSQDSIHSECKALAKRTRKSTCVGWPNGEKLRTNLSSIKVNASHRKSAQVGGQTKRKLVERKSKTCVDLRRLASPFGQG